MKAGVPLGVHFRAFGNLVDELPVLSDGETDKVQILGRILPDSRPVSRVMAD